MKVISSIRADKISFGAGNVLFVEGKDKSLDVTVLSRILPVSVKPLGASFALRGAAESFASVCPTYFFIIDRDHVDDAAVERHWKEFPKAETPNLLIWRKKELESYFLDPAFLIQSEWFDTRFGEEHIRRILTKAANGILYMSAANLVIEKVRETLKRKWIEQFTDARAFRNSETALRLLLGRPEFSGQQAKFADATRQDALRRDFSEVLEMLTGGREPLAWDCGRWLSLLPAKEMFAAVMQNACFKVKGKNGKLLTGEEKKRAIVESLVREDKRLPKDFVALREILNARALSCKGA